MEDEELEQPFWINPCGFTDEPDSDVLDMPFDRTFIKESIHTAHLSVKSALGHAKDLKEYMVYINLFNLVCM